MKRQKINWEAIREIACLTMELIKAWDEKSVTDFPFRQHGKSILMVGKVRKAKRITREIKNLQLKNGIQGQAAGVDFLDLDSLKKIRLS